VQAYDIKTTMARYGAGVEITKVYNDNSVGGRSNQYRKLGAYIETIDQRGFVFAMNNCPANQIVTASTPCILDMVTMKFKQFVAGQTKTDYKWATVSATTSRVGDCQWLEVAGAIATTDPYTVKLVPCVYDLTANAGTNEFDDALEISPADKGQTGSAVPVGRVIVNSDYLYILAPVEDGPFVGRKIVNVGVEVSPDDFNHRFEDFKNCFPFSWNPIEDNGNGVFSWKISNIPNAPLENGSLGIQFQVI